MSVRLTICTLHIKNHANSMLTMAGAISGNFRMGISEDRH